MTHNSPHNTHRRSIAWGAGAFLGVGIGGAIALALDEWLAGAAIAIGITVIIAFIYLQAGHATAELRAARINAREHDADDDDEDDGSY